MPRILHLLSLVVLVAAAFGVYKVKYGSTYEAQRVAKLRSEIRIERERLATLKAEWARLTTPQRLQDLATRHLGMQPLAVARISNLTNLPEKPAGIDGDPIGEFIERLSGEDGKRDALGEFLRALNAEPAEGRR